MKSIAKRVTAVFTMVALAAGLCFTLAACGSSAQSDEELIKTSLANTFDAFKTPTEESLSPYIDDTTKSQLDAMGIDSVEMCEHLFKHFDYTIDNVKVDGDKAVATMTIQNVDMTKVMNEVTTEMQTDMDFLAQVQSVMQSDGQKAAYALIYEKLYDAIDASQDLVSNQAEVNLAKTNGVWDVDESSMSEFVSMVYGGMDVSSL